MTWNYAYSHSITKDWIEKVIDGVMGIDFFFNKMGINCQIRELIMVKWDCNIEK